MWTACQLMNYLYMGLDNHKASHITQIFTCFFKDLPHICKKPWISSFWKDSCAKGILMYIPCICVSCLLVHHIRGKIASDMKLLYDECYDKGEVIRTETVLLPNLIWTYHVPPNIAILLSVLTRYYVFNYIMHCSEYHKSAT